jgi:hypothetical protein
VPAWNALSARLRHLRHQGHGTTGSGPSVDSGASSRNLGPCPAPACISMCVWVRQFGQLRSGPQFSRFSGVRPGFDACHFSSFALASMPSFSLFPLCSCRCATVAKGQTSRACARVGCLPILPIPRACARRGLFNFSVFARVADFSDNSLRLRAWRAPFL